MNEILGGSNGEIERIPGLIGSDGTGGHEFAD
jgi:hypothetical protein